MIIVYLCVFVCVFVCVCLCVFVCVSVCVCVLHVANVHSYVAPGWCVLVHVCSIATYMYIVVCGGDETM